VVAPRWLVSPDLVGGAAREWQVRRMCIGGPRVPPDAGSATRPGMDADPAAIAPVRRRGGPGQPSGPACRSRMPRFPPGRTQTIGGSSRQARPTMIRLPYWRLLSSGGRDADVLGPGTGWLTARPRGHSA
jgi:hypothetical protein